MSIEIEKKLSAILTASVLTLNGCGTNTSKNKVEQQPTTKTEVVKNAKQNSTVKVNFEKKTVTIEKEKTLESLNGKKFENFNAFFKELVPIVRNEWKDGGTSVKIDNIKDVFASIKLLNDNLAKVTLFYKKPFKNREPLDWEEEVYLTKIPEYEGIKRPILKQILNDGKDSFKNLVISMNRLNFYIQDLKDLSPHRWDNDKLNKKWTNYRLPKNEFDAVMPAKREFWCDPAQKIVNIYPASAKLLGLRMSNPWKVWDYKYLYKILDSRYEED